MRAASIFYRGMFDTQKFSISSKHVLNISDLQNDSNFHQMLKAELLPHDQLISEITVKSQLYKNGDLIVVEVEDIDTLKVGIIITIVVRKSDVFFACKLFSCSRNFLQYFESRRCSSHLSFVNSDDLADFKTLVMRGTVEKFSFVLHHGLSVNFA